MSVRYLLRKLEIFFWWFIEADILHMWCNDTCTMHSLAFCVFGSVLQKFVRLSKDSMKISLVDDHLCHFFQIWELCVLSWMNWLFLVVIGYFEIFTPEKMVANFPAPKRKRELGIRSYSSFRVTLICHFKSTRRPFRLEPCRQLSLHLICGKRASKLY